MAKSKGNNDNLIQGIVDYINNGSKKKTSPAKKNYEDRRKPKVKGDVMEYGMGIYKYNRKPK